MYQRTLGALPAALKNPLTAANAAPISAAGGGSLGTILVVGALAGGGYLLWRKFRKKG